MTEERAAPWAVAIVALLLGVCEMAPVAGPYTWVNRDGRFYVNMLATITEHGSLNQDEFAASWYTGQLFWNHALDGGWSNVAMGRDGHRWPKHSWMLPALAWPLYFAMGLWGTLVFNMLVMCAAAVACYRFARAYTSPAPAAIAALTLLYATSIREYAYDFHVDVLLLGLSSLACASAAARRGLAAGLLIGIGALLRPTTMAVSIPVTFLLMERRAYREIGRAVLGGLVMLGLGGTVNTFIFGRPWWTGYNRIIIVEHGHPVVQSVTHSFSVPLREGMERTWQGGLGLRTRFTVMAAALPGLVSLLRRKPWTAMAAIVFGTVFFFVFSVYEYEGDRFHWPWLVVLVPALARTYWLFGRAVRWIPGLPVPVMAAIGGACAAALSLPLMPGGQALLAAPEEAAKHIAAAAAVAAAAALLLGWLRAPAVVASCAVAPLLARELRELTPTSYQPLYWIAGIAIVSIPLVRWTARGIARLAARVEGPRRAWLLALVVVAIAMISGVTRHVLAATAPFHLSSERTVRHIEVRAGDIPCDFLAWEHFAWECSHVDSGTYGEVGLALPDGVTVGGVRKAMLIVPSAPWGQPRTVHVPLPDGAHALRLVWGVPDGLPGGVDVELRVRGQVVDHFEVPPVEHGRLHVRRVVLPAGTHALELVVTAPHGGGGRAVVALDATLSAR